MRFGVHTAFCAMCGSEVRQDPHQNTSPSLPLSVTLVTRFLLENRGPQGLCLKFLFPTRTGEYAFIPCLTWKPSLRRGKFKCNSMCTEDAQDVSLQGSRVVLDQSETDVPCHLLLNLQWSCGGGQGPGAIVTYP